MWKGIVAMGVGGWAFLGLACGPTAWAKPADLPVPSQMQCPDGEETGGFGDLPTEPGVEAIDAVPTTIDAVMPALFEQLLQQAVDALRQQRAATPGAPLTDTEKVANARDLKAQRLFEVAERWRRTGDYENARIAYQRVHLLSPTTKLGRLAIDRIQEVEERMRDTSEESEGEDHESMFYQMRENSVPLGLVEVSY